MADWVGVWAIAAVVAYFKLSGWLFGMRRSLIVPCRLDVDCDFYPDLAHSLHLEKSLRSYQDFDYLKRFDRPGGENFRLEL
jgi:hypothetical protein